MLEVLGIALVVALVITLFIRPSATVAVILALGVVGAAIAVSWNDVEQTKAQRAAVNAALERQSASTAAVTVPTPAPTHAGS
ncbi:MAG TPA: hypothetical protein VG651_16530 [Stellaceae bacterium]|nr:hypothetical protein [Stellaceae bacterium]